MPLDPKAKALIDQMAAAGGPPLNQLAPTEARRQGNEMLRMMGGQPAQVARVEDRKIPGPAGEIALRIYAPSGSGPFPVLVFFHGGGWVIGDLNSHDIPCRALTNGSGCVTVAVDYRLAPEHKFPAAAEDCYAATKWVAENAASIGGDARRIAIGGDSAGGNLSAAVALMARDRGQPSIAFQLLIYPATDGALNTYSHKTFTNYFLTDELCAYFWKQYIRSDADRSNPYAAPFYAKDLKGLPPALVITAEFDPLRDEGEAYAEKMRAAGVPVKISRYDGMIHGFFSMGAVLDQGNKAIAEAAEALKVAFRK
jgi:acetyl esterase